MTKQESAATRANLKDVAARSGVSTFTASRALSGHAGVAADTVKRVLEAASDLGYVANQHAQNLKGRRSKVIGIVAASKGNQYYATLVGAIEEVVEKSDYSCFVADAVTHGVYSPERENRIVESMIQQRVAAVVLTYVIHLSNIRRLEQWNIPVIFVDCVPPGPKASYHAVTSDNVRAGGLMGDHLGSLGYQRWCFVGHARNWNTREPRQKGFEEAARRWDATVDIIEGENDSDVTRKAVHAYLTGKGAAQRPHAVFASNTILLKGVMMALKDMDLSIPRQIAVVGFDEFDWADLLTPPITVIDQHIGTIGARAGVHLLSILDGEDLPSRGGRGVVLEPTLRVRQSCGADLASMNRPGANNSLRSKIKSKT